MTHRRGGDNTHHMDALTKVHRAKRKRRRSELEWREAIQAAFADGHSLRAIGREAGVHHTRILQIVRQQEADDA